MANSFKKDWGKIRIINRYWYAIVEKEIAGGIYQEIQQHAKANNKYMKTYDKNKELPYLKYWDVNNLYSWIMSQKLPVNNLE